MRNNPALDIDVEKGDGVPISAIIFGGRRSDTMPLVFQSFDWKHGVYLGATMASETTAAATRAVGQVRRDPMAMLPFCGYNIGDYFRHWLDICKRLSRPPKIFHVNWFRTDQDGHFLWPGYGENIRVLEWMIGRIHGDADARATVLGRVPAPASIDLSGLGLGDGAYDELFEVDRDAWASEAEEHRRFLSEFGPRLPDAVLREHAALLKRIEAARSTSFVREPRRSPRQVSMK